MSLNADGEVYIDVEDALKRIGGNMDLYKRLLKRFVDGNQIEELQNSVTRGDNQEEAVRHAHTLKGVSANLSLVKLRTQAAELEAAIKDGLDNSALLSELAVTYDDTVKTIKELLG